MNNKKLELAIEKFRKNEISIGKAARMADVPLSQFMSILVKRKVDFHYGLKELREDFEGFI